jgi:hypothetical protein
MALSNPRSIFGIASVAPYNINSKEFYGMLRVLENSSLAVTGEQIALQGGSNRFDWSSETGAITAEMSLNFSEYPNFVFELFAGNAPTLNAAEASGSVTTPVAGTGSLINASTGVASVTIESGEEDELKFGHYVIKAASATTVDVYFSSQVDIGRGTNGEFLNDAMKVVSTLTVTDSGGTTSITGYGLEITGGSGTVALTSGDTISFSVRPPNSESTDVVVGRLADQNWPEFGAIIMAAQQSDGQMIEIDAYRCKAAGLPIGLARNAYSPAEVTVKMLYDSTRDGVYALRHVKPS